MRSAMSTTELKELLTRLDVPGLELIEEPELLKALFDFGQLPIPPLAVELAGLGMEGRQWSIEPAEHPLTVRVVFIGDQKNFKVVHEIDPVGELIDCQMPHSPGSAYLPHEGNVIDHAIAALHASIERLEGYRDDRKAGKI